MICHDLPSYSSCHAEKTSCSEPTLEYSKSRSAINSQIYLTLSSYINQMEQLSFQNKVLEILITLQEQNGQILHLLKKLKRDKGQQNININLPELPVSLPLGNSDDLNRIEHYLSSDDNLSALSIYLATLGGKNVLTQTNRILRQLLSDQVASSYNFYGSRNQKRLFTNLKLTKLVIRKKQFGY